MKEYVIEGRIRVVARPNASKTCVLGYDGAREAVRISVAAPPEGGKANLELVRFISKELGKKVELVSGGTSRLKVFRVV